MLAVVLILLLLILLFGGLGIFVAKAFLFVALVALIVGVATGGMTMRGRR